MFLVLADRSEVLPSHKIVLIPVAEMEDGMPVGGSEGEEAVKVTWSVDFNRPIEACSRDLW